MNQVDKEFLSKTRNNQMRSLFSAHSLIDHVSTEILLQTAFEFCFRSNYCYKNGKDIESENAFQFATQIEGALVARGVNDRLLSETINNLLIA
jgi:hypothetical protein